MNIYNISGKRLNELERAALQRYGGKIIERKFFYQNNISLTLQIKTIGLALGIEKEPCVIITPNIKNAEKVAAKLFKAATILPLLSLSANK